MGLSAGRTQAVRLGLAGTVIAALALAGAWVVHHDDATTRPSAQAVAWSHELDALAHRIDGTAQVRYDVGYVGYYQTQNALVACMAAAGFHYAPPSFPPRPAGVPVNTHYANWLAPIGNTLWYSTDRAFGSASVSLDTNHLGLSTRQQRAYDAALQFCQDIHPQVATQPGYPDLHLQLRSELNDLLAPVESKVWHSYGDEYATCLAGRGYDLKGLGYDDADPDALYLSMERRFPAAPPAPGQAGGRRWRAAVAVEQAAARADAACRADAYWAGIRMLGPSLDRFVAAHQSQLAELDRQYAALHRRVLTGTAGEASVSG